MWPALGWLGANLLCFGIGKVLLPNPPIDVVIYLLIGAGILGATLGKIAEGSVKE